MIISILPFPRSIGVTVEVSPTVYVLFVGKLWNQVPPLVPEGRASVTAFIDLPDEGPEGIEWLLANQVWIKRKIFEWLIAPAALN